MTDRPIAAAAVHCNTHAEHDVCRKISQGEVASRGVGDIRSVGVLLRRVHSIALVVSATSHETITATAGYNNPSRTVGFEVRTVVALKASQGIQTVDVDGG